MVTNRRRPLCAGGRGDLLRFPWNAAAEARRQPLHHTRTPSVTYARQTPPTRWIPTTYYGGLPPGMEMGHRIPSNEILSFWDVGTY